MVLATTVIAQTISAPTISETKGQDTDNLQTSFYRIQQPTPQNLKLFLAQAVAKYGNPKDYFTLYNVIQCESSWDYTNKNPDSSAYGLAQFLDGTWSDHCKGERNNPYDQIRCLVVNWYEGHQSWWNESKYCWGKYLSK